MTVGSREYEIFEEKQHLSESAGKAYFTPIVGDLTALHRNEYNAVQPQQFYLWGKFELCPIHRHYTHIDFVALPPSSRSKIDHSRELIALQNAGVRVIKHSRVPFEIHLRKKCKDKPLVPIVALKALAIDKDRHANLYDELVDDGFEAFGDGDGLDLADFMFAIDAHMKKTRDFVDVDAGMNLWIKRLSPIEYDTADMKNARGIAKELFRGSTHKQKQLVRAIEFANLSFDQIETLHEDFVKIQAHSFSVAKVDVDMENQISVDDLLLYLNERRTKLVEMLFNLMDIDVGKSLEAETLDFADFVSFVSRLCTMGRHDLVRFLFFSMGANAEHSECVHREQVMPLIYMVRNQYPRSTSEQQLKKVSIAFNLPENLKFEHSNDKRRNIGIYGVPDFHLSDMFELDRRFGSLFSPLYKLKESFEKKFLGERFWRGIKYEFFKARQYVSSGIVEDLFREDEVDEEEDEEDDND